MNILYSCGDKTFAELTKFPLHKSMTTPDYWQKIEQEKQRRAQAPEAISQNKDDSADEEKISDAFPPKLVPKALTGRIRPEWKRNAK